MKVSFWAPLRHSKIAAGLPLLVEDRGDHRLGIELRNGSNSEVPIQFEDEKATSSRRNGLATRSLAQSETPCMWRSPLYGTWGGLTRARTGAGPAREGRGRTPSMHADEKSDEAIVPRKRPNKGRQIPAEVVEGRASPKGNSRQAAVVRTPSRVATSIRLAAVRRNACRFKLCAPPAFDPRGGPGGVA